ncbi:MAG: phosphoribosylanthranilate isomerase [Oscillospiraceae bacterium]
MVRVKICGLMRGEDVALCARAGAHALGFVTEYPVPVPWNLTGQRARELIETVPPFVTSCMVTAGSAEKVLLLAGRVRPDIVQLHGDETLEETVVIAAELKRIGIRCIRALRIDKSGGLRFSIPDPGEAARKLSETDVSALLVDSYTDTMPGGTGIKADMRVYDTVCENTNLPVIVGGGLRPDNLAEILGNRRPFAIDVLTGVEAAGGLKDKEKIGALMSASATLN